MGCTNSKSVIEPSQYSKEINLEDLHDLCVVLFVKQGDKASDAVLAEASGRTINKKFVVGADNVELAKKLGFKNGPAVAFFYRGIRIARLIGRRSIIKKYDEFADKYAEYAAEATKQIEEMKELESKGEAKKPVNPSLPIMLKSIEEHNGFITCPPSKKIGLIVSYHGDDDDEVEEIVKLTDAVKSQVEVRGIDLDQHMEVGLACEYLRPCAVFVTGDQRKQLGYKFGEPMVACVNKNIKEAGKKGFSERPEHVPMTPAVIVPPQQMGEEKEEEERKEEEEEVEKVVTLEEMTQKKIEEDNENEKKEGEEEGEEKICEDDEAKDDE
ncbi:hypothetical protein ADUPG1_006657 [Aduncisulcus paluster]|uniref:Uncharacterized protein n=1 Tax=Aduncisulcus paluster TaxID=2918883 RepID=A0ABQ5KJ23_9EUKA|nr:hypothetical protein ADUPG1_006657 [Aduncisulcus paluster]